jgi:triosephosphate isomerase
MNKKLIVGNWKMNPTSLEEAKRIYRSVNNISKKLSSTDVVICPPFVYIKSFLSKNSTSLISIGAQNIFTEEQGSFTGEISPLMLKNLGVTHVIVGHSERRARGETDEMVARKVQLVIDSGMNPIMCVGEKERDANGDYLHIVRDQIKNSLNKVSKKDINRLIVAYEPIWAVGAKEAMSPKDLHEMSLFVKKVLSDIYGHDEAMSTKILYGGDANFRNAADLITVGQVNGLLLGRASINSAGFVELLKTVDPL